MRKGKVPKEGHSKEPKPSTRKLAPKKLASEKSTPKKAAARKVSGKSSSTGSSTKAKTAKGKKKVSLKDEAYAYKDIETRKSLIKRLENWSDRVSWDEFYRIYSQFVFRFGLKSGLTTSEANDAMQETFIGVAKNLQQGRFKLGVGSFKAWLTNQARWRVIDQFRNRKKDLSAQNQPRVGESDRRTATLDRHEDPKGESLQKIWEREWRESLLEIALKSIKSRVAPLHYQIYYCYVIKEWKPTRSWLWSRVRASFMKYKASISAVRFR